MRTLAHITADALPDGEGERLDLLAMSLAGLSKDADHTQARRGSASGKHRTERSRQWPAGMEPPSSN
jgi:hypothetical protein